MRKLLRWFLNGIQIICLIPVVLGLIVAGIGILAFMAVAELNYE